MEAHTYITSITVHSIDGSIQTNIQLHFCHRQ